jgi:hypothetical protein
MFCLLSPGWTESWLGRTLSRNVWVEKTMTEEEIKAYAHLALAKHKEASERFDRRRVVKEFVEISERNIAALARSRMLGGAEEDWKLSESEGSLTVMSGKVFVRHCFFPEPSGGAWPLARYFARRAWFARLGKERYFERHWRALAEKIAAEDAKCQVYDNGAMPAGLLMERERQELCDEFGQEPSEGLPSASERGRGKAL